MRSIVLHERACLLVRLGSCSPMRTSHSAKSSGTTCALSAAHGSRGVRFPHHSSCSVHASAQKHAGTAQTLTRYVRTSSSVRSPALTPQPSRTECRRLLYCIYTYYGYIVFKQTRYPKNLIRSKILYPNSSSVGLPNRASWLIVGKMRTWRKSSVSWID